MRVLISAYACEPGRGSEPGVGWRWATTLASTGHVVWVLTRANNQPKIEEALKAHPYPNLTFAYLDLPDWVTAVKSHLGLTHLYYIAWQIRAISVGKQMCQEHRIDLAHHLTFGVFRHFVAPTWWGRPYIFGPLGGGESTPRQLRPTYPLYGRFWDALRDWANRLSKFDPLLHLSLRRATVILCKTRETMHCLPAMYHHKCRIQVEIGIDTPPDLEITDDEQSPVDSLRLLYVGRLVHWKGVHLGLMAFAKFQAAYPNARLTIIGDGPEREWLKRTADKLGLNDAVEWVPWLEQADVLQRYTNHDVFLFPSLHDSSGNVVLEALSRGIPVVCLNLGGPGAIVDESCGFVVEAENRDVDEVINSLAVALITIQNDQSLHQTLKQGALSRAAKFNWDSVVSDTYVRLTKEVANTSK